jgi:hypothetical protein
MRGKLTLGIALAALLASAGVALATFQGTVLYDPPLLKFTDFSGHMSEENVIVRRAGADFTMTASPSPPTIDGDSDPGCEFTSGGVSCPRAGVERIVILLGGIADSVDIDLGASATAVDQIAKGQDGADDLVGGAGTQTLLGGPGEDTLRGGPGADFLRGGPGTDVCFAQPIDTVIGCEPAGRR